MDKDKIDKISNRIGYGVAAIIAISVFLSLVGGISVKNIISGTILAVSFLFFLLGGVYGQKFKLYKEAYNYTFIAMLTLMASNAVDKYL